MWRTKKLAKPKQNQKVDDAHVKPYSDFSSTHTQILRRWNETVYDGRSSIQAKSEGFYCGAPKSIYLIKEVEIRKVLIS